MEPYSRIFRPELLGLKNYATGLKPEDVTSYCPFTGLTFMTRLDAYDKCIPDPTSIIVKIHGAFSLSPSPSSTPSSSSTSASAPASASASASTSFTSWSATDLPQNTSIPSQTGAQSTYPVTLGPAGASTAFGLFYGWNSPMNSVGIVPHVYEQSKPHVDLFTAGMVLMNLLQTPNFANPLNGVIRNVVLVTDSNYLFSCLTEHVYAWQSKGYRNAKGKEVSNANAVKWVEGLVEEFERHDVCVKFWKVDKNDNREAVDLARRFLDLNNQFRRLIEYWNCLIGRL